MKKKHLTEEQRYLIFAYIQSGKSQKEISQLLGFNKSTISCELSRNSDGRSCIYNPNLAHRKYQKRITKRVHFKKFTDSLRTIVDTLLVADFSSEQVSGYFKLHLTDSVSHKTIYQYIWADKRKGDKELYKHLRHRGKHYANVVLKQMEEGL